MRMASKLNMFPPKVCAGCLNFGDDVRFCKVNKKFMFLAEIYNNAKFPDLLLVCFLCFYRINKFMNFRLSVVNASVYLKSIIDDLRTGKTINYDDLKCRREALKIKDLSTSFVECVDTVDFVLATGSNLTTSDSVTPLAPWDQSTDIKVELDRDKNDAAPLSTEIPIFEMIDVPRHCDTVKNEKIDTFYAEGSPLSHDRFSTSIARCTEVPSGALSTANPAVMAPVESTPAEGTYKPGNPHLITDGGLGFKESSVEIAPLPYVKTAAELIEQRLKMHSRTASDRANIADGVQLLYRTKDEVLAEIEKRKCDESYTVAQFKCSLCFRGYSILNEYETHMQLHSTSRGAHVCYICQQAYNTKSYLVKHLVQHYRRYKCTLCDFVKGNRSLVLRHYVKVHQADLSEECKECGDIFLKTPFEQHICMKRLEKCLYCDKRLSKSSLKTHILLRHEERNHKCGHCNKMFPSAKLLCLHESSHKDNFYCAKCDLIFMRKESYIFHMRHSRKHPNHLRPENLRQCGHCPLKVPYNSYVRHCDKMHPIIGKYKCKECPEAFSAQNSYYNHIRTSHRKNKVRKYICNYCGREFTVKNILISHINTHTGARPFVCPVCMATFAHPAALYTHNRIVHLKVKRKNGCKATKLNTEIQTEVVCGVRNDTDACTE